MDGFSPTRFLLVAGLGLLALLAVAATVQAQSVSVQDTAVTEGDAGEKLLTVNVSISDPTGLLGGTVDYTTSDGTATAGEDYNATNGTLTWDVLDGATKTFQVAILGDTLKETNETFTVTLSDPVGGVLGILDASATVTITNDDANNPPTLADPADRSVDEGGTVAFTAVGADVDPIDTVTYSLGAGAPGGAVINSSTGAFSWTPNETHGGSAYPISIQVTDTIAVVSQTFNVTVNETNLLPVLDAIGAKTVDEGSLLAFNASATDADLPANVLTYSLGPSAPTGASIDNATGAFAWTPSEAQDGVHVLNITVSDGLGGLDWELVTVTVAEVPTDPVLGAIGAKAVDEGSLLAFNASATDVDLPANTLSYGLGAGAPVGAVINSSTGAFSWTPNETQDGVHVLNITVSDGLGGLDWELVAVTVAEVPSAPVLDPISDQSAKVGQTLNISLIQASDPDGDPVTFSNASALPGTLTLVDNGDGTAYITGVVSSAGTYTLNITVTDGVLTDWDLVTLSITTPKSSGGGGGGGGGGPAGPGAAPVAAPAGAAGAWQYELGEVDAGQALQLPIPAGPAPHITLTFEGAASDVIVTVVAWGPGVLPADSRFPATASHGMLKVTVQGARGTIEVAFNVPADADLDRLLVVKEGDSLTVARPVLSDTTDLLSSLLPCCSRFYLLEDDGPPTVAMEDVAEGVRVRIDDGVALQDVQVTVGGDTQDLSAEDRSIDQVFAVEPGQTLQVQASDLAGNTLVQSHTAPSGPSQGTDASDPSPTPGEAGDARVPWWAVVGPLAAVALVAAAVLVWHRKD